LCFIVYDKAGEKHIGFYDGKAAVPAKGQKRKREKHKRQIKAEIIENWIFLCKRPSINCRQPCLQLKPVA
jgi:hypothetical protein